MNPVPALTKDFETSYTMASRRGRTVTSLQLHSSVEEASSQGRRESWVLRSAFIILVHSSAPIIMKMEVLVLRWTQGL